VGTGSRFLPCAASSTGVVQSDLAMNRFVRIQVDCYAGYKGEESPRSFVWNDRRHEVEEIVDRWYQASRDPQIPACDYFKVRTADGALFLLRMDRETSTWHLVRAVPDEGGR
jgi:hypothetical protein